ncbi:conserved hypothetical integral membrane protein [Virgibacillus subterraneus]|uniref:Conserved hypothetical integral membrane protein n=2 Tax=Virgibacillus TaxID=84406 RepID=A0A1H0YDU0_9BACI|nr:MULTISPECIES: DUF1146 family protein [Virgibacillus]SDQ13337.1 conserved hypothetical integral membrane protein [Virgibacillus salinus]SEP73454.1 conserved hypothetical integral membrane protein [Virgibacillus subterraneus]
MSSIGLTALISMISHLIFIYITWRVVTTVNFDPLIRKGRETEARILIMFITIVIGAGVSRFFLEFLQWSQDLMFLF